MVNCDLIDNHNESYIYVRISIVIRHKLCLSASLINRHAYILYYIFQNQEFRGSNSFNFTQVFNNNMFRGKGEQRRKETGKHHPNTDLEGTKAFVLRYPVVWNKRRSIFWVFLLLLFSHIPRNWRMSDKFHLAVFMQFNMVPRMVSV